MITIRHVRAAFVPALVVAAFCGAPAAGEPSHTGKSASTFYGPRARANAARNAQRYDWAKRQVDEAVAAARPWVETPDEALWQMIFSPRLKRALAVNVDAGCPRCGEKIYGARGSNLYAWTQWVPGHPWKVQCPACKELFPKNDFGAFYRSAIDPETGLFDPGRGDRSLLFNAEHPDPSDPLRTWGVDDGSGWQRSEGGLDQRDWYIGYHVHYGLNGQISAAIRSLATAYSLTGEAIYVHKCAILLDRLADVYPDYSGADEQFYNNVWHRYSEGIVGPNYWAGSAWAQRAIDYDMVFDGIGAMPETLAFIRGQARRYRVPRPKESVEDIRRNIEQRILIDMGTHPERIAMNGTSTEMARATVDLVLRGEAAVREFVDRHMPAIVPPTHLNDDGSGNERSTGYDAGAFGGYCSLVEQLARQDIRVARAALDGYPKLRAAFDFWPDIWCLERFIPNIGDVGEPGSTSGPAGSAGAYLTLFDLTGEARYAQVAVRIVGGDTTKLPRNIFADDPEGLVQRAIEADRAAGPWWTPSVVKKDYKLGILRSPGILRINTARGVNPPEPDAGNGPHALWLFYSPAAGTSSHSHFDALTFGLFAFGLPMVCEQGYPLYTGDWPARWAWTSHTRSHATVVVDGECQIHCDGGRLLGFGRRGPVQMISAEAPCVYAPGLARYRRTMVLVMVSPENSFILDVFRARGGREHHYTVPVFYADRTTGGLDLSPHADLYGGHVERVTSADTHSAWWVDHAVRTAWDGKVAAHLRVHGPAAEATVLLGEGETRLGHEAAQRLPYLIIQRRAAGQDELDSTFVVAYEPYLATPFLAAPALTVDADGGLVTAEILGAGARSRYVLTIEDGAADGVTVRTRINDGDEIVVSGVSAPAD